MKKFTVIRSFIRSQFQVVEAVDEDDAIEKAQQNPEGFDECINSDDDWEYRVQ